jgi:hypothetical protein
MLGKRFYLSLIIIFTFFQNSSIFYSNFIWAQKAAGVETRVDYENVLSYLINLDISSNIAVVDKEISFQRDVGIFKLFNGKIYTCSTFNDEIHAIYFKGKGEFSFIPPTKIEQDQLYRFYEKDEFPIEFKTLFLLFTDSTYFELNNLAQFNTGETDSRISRKISNCVEYLLNSDVGYSRSDFLRSILDGGNNGFFYSHIEGSGKPFFFQINPYEEEEVSFTRPFRTALISRARKEIINQFAAGTDNHLIKKFDKHFLDIISYKIESTIEDNLDFSAECTIDFTANEKKQRWTTFYLYEELEVDSIIWEDGQEADYIRIPENDELWILINKKYLDSEQHWYKIYYHGDLLERNDYGWIAIESSIYWYPRYDYRTKAYFGLKFHTPAKYDFISVGDLIHENKDEDILSTTWICNEPIRNASFNIGKFEKNEIQEKNLPTINVYMSEYGHR